MLKKTIEYIDLNDEKRKEDFYFNFTKSELTELELSEDGGLSNMIKRLVSANNTKEIVTLFKRIILKSYGEKSDDGRYFKKSEELSNNFYNSPAYDALFLELVSDPEKASSFIKGLLPKDMQQQVEQTILADNSLNKDA